MYLPDGREANAIHSQGTIFSWIRSGAFSSTASSIVSGYRNIPVGAIAHVSEPGATNVSREFFDAWYSGYPFIECANMNMKKISLTTIVGDPFVKFR
jgi:hypothetical protein